MKQKNIFINISSWLSPTFKIVMFIAIFLALSPNNLWYYIIVDWFAVIGFSYLSYISYKNEKLSSLFYGLCVIAFFSGVQGFTKKGIYTRDIWKMIDVMACTIIIVCSSYELAIDIIKKNYEEKIKEINEKNETDMLIKQIKMNK